MARESFFLALKSDSLDRFEQVERSKKPELEETSFMDIQVLKNALVKLSQSQNGLNWLYGIIAVKVQLISKANLMYLFEPKKERKYFCGSAQASKMDQIIKIMAHYHGNQ